MCPRALTDSHISQVPPRSRPFKLFDGNGLFLLVTPKGGRFWRLKFRHHGKEGSLSFGVYPEVSIEAARTDCAAARRLLSQGINPSEARKAERRAAQELATQQEVEREAPTEAERVKVSIALDGDCFEIWKGPTVLRLTREQAGQLCELLRTFID